MLVLFSFLIFKTGTRIEVLIVSKKCLPYHKPNYYHGISDMLLLVSIFFMDQSMNTMFQGALDKSSLAKIGANP